jgi:hypothetical protein
VLEAEEGVEALDIHEGGGVNTKVSDMILKIVLKMMEIECIKSTKHIYSCLELRSSLGPFIINYEQTRVCRTNNRKEWTVTDSGHIKAGKEFF